MAAISTPGKAVSVTPNKNPPLSANNWFGTSQTSKPPGSNAGKAPGPPQQLPTGTGAPLRAAPAPVTPGAAPTPQNGPVGPQQQPPAVGPFGTGSQSPGGVKLPTSMSELRTALSSVANPGYGMMSRMTESTPPLSFMTSRLGGLQGPADSILKGVQSVIKDDPARFAGLAGGLAPGLTSGLLSAGPIGMAAMPALYGALNGGESFAATNQFLKPLLPRLGLG